ncbi:hypothetical protein ST37_10485 [Vibrio sp. qd031]|nr:hypothetical protein ST37_10485 [Vibrio sp. qd031]
MDVTGVKITYESCGSGTSNLALELMHQRYELEQGLVDNYIINGTPLNRLVMLNFTNLEG